MSATPRLPQPLAAVPADLEALLDLEQEVFPPERQESRSALARSLRSAFQEVWWIRLQGVPAASLTLRKYPKSLRLYSLAVRNGFRGRGLGERLMRKAFRRASELGVEGIRLEADADTPRLIDWYTRQGFLPVAEVPDYYGPGTRALRMFKNLSSMDA